MLLDTIKDIVDEAGEVREVPSAGIEKVGHKSCWKRVTKPQLVDSNRCVVHVDGYTYILTAVILTLCVDGVYRIYNPLRKEVPTADNHSIYRGYVILDPKEHIEYVFGVVMEPLLTPANHNFREVYWRGKFTGSFKTMAGIIDNYTLEHTGGYTDWYLKNYRGLVVKATVNEQVRFAEPVQLVKDPFALFNGRESITFGEFRVTNIPKTVDIVTRIVIKQRSDVPNYSIKVFSLSINDKSETECVSVPLENCDFKTRARYRESQVFSINIPEDTRDHYLIAELQIDDAVYWYRFDSRVKLKGIIMHMSAIANRIMLASRNT